ncbi:rhodanese-like domain-containing protein [Kineococcus sp. R8]|uniref:rhodanese-like domain-containing protein n=1 Tax=Kineococcus siccus TaxID=2696567 RepID=UPI0014132965|nr:rhodanese-like domain-containing protein [Kineococcus siccus]NAZ83229.1 rhodanese-like domain-containing protein [Kineococcus siccus]
MDAQTAHTRRADVTVVDVREDEEWAAGHISDARHIPLGQLRTRLGELAPERVLVTVCRSGKRSAKAHALLTAAGRRVDDLDGGMQAWAAAGLPVVTDDGRPGTVA